MEKTVLNRIRSIEKDIVQSLKNEDFVSIPALSIELDKLIKEFAVALKTNGNLDSDLKKLEQLSKKLEFFKTQTATAFKGYRSKVSDQTKMRLAYKKYSE